MVIPPGHTANAYRFLTMYSDLSNYGRVCSPRGQKILEIEDYVLRLEAGESCLTSFKSRKLNLPYAVNEFLWYLRADPYDTSIEEYASLWPKIRQPEGFYFSNYGQYMFGQTGGIPWVIEELMRDKDSRRAAFPLLKQEHCFGNNRDMVCTYSMGFRIRDNRLNMSVNMRSNDAVFGTTNDVFCFWMVYQLVYAILRHSYRDLDRGTYVHKVDSLHVYERHWEMLRSLIEDGISGYYSVPIPEMTHEEAYGLIQDQASTLTREGEFAKWILTISQCNSSNWQGLGRTNISS